MNIKRFLLTLLGVTPFILYGQQISVKVEGFQSNNGSAMIALYDSSDSWLKTTYRGVQSSIVNGTATASFDAVPPGEYAISLFHDENGNGKMETNMFGIPKEEYACSRGARGNFGPPAWDGAKFSHSDEGQHIHISID